MLFGYARVNTDRGRTKASEYTEAGVTGCCEEELGTTL